MSMDLARVLEHSFITLTAGISLALIIFIILTSQVGLYFWRRPVHSCDPVWMKGVIVSIWVIQALELALACRMSFSAHRKGSEGLEMIFCEWAGYLGTSAMTTFLVHSLFVRRIYLLGKGLETIMMPIVLILVVILEGSFGLVSFLYVVNIKFQDQPIPLPWAVFVWLGLSITADILIAGLLCYILNKNRTRVARSTDRMIKRLMSFFIQTGLVTSVAAVVTVTIWTVAKLDTRHLWMSFPMGGIYATCLMANFIARESYLHPRVPYEDIELSLPGGNMVFVTPENLTKSSPESPESSASERPSETHTLSVSVSSDGSGTAVEL